MNYAPTNGSCHSERRPVALRQIKNLVFGNEVLSLSENEILRPSGGVVSPVRPLRMTAKEGFYVANPPRLFVSSTQFQPQLSLTHRPLRETD